MLPFMPRWTRSRRLDVKLLGIRGGGDNIITVKLSECPLLYTVMGYNSLTGNLIRFIVGNILESVLKRKIDLSRLGFAVLRLK